MTAPRPGASALTKRRLIIGAIILGIIVLLIVLIGLITPRSGASRHPKPARAAAKPTPAARTHAAPRPAAAAHPASAARIDLHALTRLPFQFEKGSAEGTVQSARNLDHLVRDIRNRLDREPDKTLEVGGHASAEGPGYLQQKLGEKRAEYAARYLEQHGIPEDRIALRNYAATRPVTDGNGEDLVASRRATVRLVDKRR